MVSAARGLRPTSSIASGTSDVPCVAGSGLMPGQVQHRGVEVHDLDVRLHDLALGEDAGRADDEGDVDQFLVDGVAVADAAVLPELVAVVGDDDDRGTCRRGLLLQIGDERREDGVALGDLAVVQRLEVGAVVVVDLELAALDDAELHAGLHRLDRPAVGLVPVLDEEPLGRVVDHVRLDGGEVDELRLRPLPSIHGLADLPDVVGAVGQVLADEVAVDVPAALEAPLAPTRSRSTRTCAVS